MKDKKGFDVSYNAQTSVDSKHKLIAEFKVTNDGSTVFVRLAIFTKRRRLPHTKMVEVFTSKTVVICPMGRVIPPKFYKNVDRTARYYNYSACAKCTCRCTKSKYMAYGVRMKKQNLAKNLMPLIDMSNKYI